MTRDIPPNSIAAGVPARVLRQIDERDRELHAHVTQTAKADVYAMIFDQKGLMAGIGLQGSKITKLKR